MHAPTVSHNRSRRRLVQAPFLWIPDQLLANFRRYSYSSYMLSESRTTCADSTPTHNPRAPYPHVCCPHDPSNYTPTPTQVAPQYPRRRRRTQAARKHTHTHADTSCPNTHTHAGKLPEHTHTPIHADTSYPKHTHTHANVDEGFFSALANTRLRYYSL